jgi:hypothetical protein
MLGVTAEKVIGWIKSGQLRAVNLSNGAQRPRYRIDLDDLARFECSRAVGKQSPRPRRRRRPEPSSEIWFP